MAPGITVSYRLHTPSSLPPTPMLAITEGVMKSVVLWVGLSGLLAATSAADDLTGLSAAQLNARGLALFEQHQYHEAELAYRASLAAWDRLGNRFAAGRSVTAANLGTLLWMEGRYSDAEPLFLQRMQQTEAGPDAPA